MSTAVSRFNKSALYSIVGYGSVETGGADPVIIGDRVQVGMHGFRNEVFIF